MRIYPEFFLERLDMRFHLRLIAGLSMIAFAGATNTPCGAQTTDFGKPGDPIKLTVGYQPFYTEAWSAVVMKSKEFWKKHLPAGSEVTFEPGLQGNVLVGQMIAGKQQIGYMGDMPAIVASSKPDVADIRIVAVAGTSQQQCNIFLVRKDAPEFKSAEEALKWFDGKIVASPQGSCTDRFARTVFQKNNIKPAKYFNQAGDQLAENLKTGKLDGAVVWEPITAKFIADGVARRVASGVNFNESDSGFVVMRQDLIAARPDVLKGWMEAELDAQLFLADSKNSNEIAAMAAKEAPAYSKKTLWTSLYGEYPASVGGDPQRLVLDFIVTPKLEKIIKDDTAFLFDLKRVPADSLRGGAVADQVARQVLESRKLKSPLGAVKALPIAEFRE
jgi:NitT/TauT family transport system substrate-binding protein